MIESGKIAKTKNVLTIVHLIRSAAVTVQVLHPNYPRTHHLWHTTTQSYSPALHVSLPKREVFRNYPDCFLRAATPNRLFASISLDPFHKPFIRSARTRACNDASLNSYPQYSNELWTGLSRASLLPDCPPVHIRTFIRGSPPATLTFA